MHPGDGVIPLRTTGAFATKTETHERGHIMSMNKPIDRRDAIKMTAAAGAAIAGACLPASAFATAPIPDSWDEEADFVVVGSGTALTGALAAAVEGCSVIVLEKANHVGGTTAISGGQVWAPCNRYSENPDDREAARTYMLRVADDLSTDAVIDTYLDNINDMVEMVAEECGVEWSVSPRIDYHANWEGASKNTRSLSYVIDGVRKGLHFIEPEAARIEELGGKILLSTPARKLVTRLGEDGVCEVLGVIAADQDGNELAIKARKGVLIGAGGFGFNYDMRKRYHNIPTRYAMTVPEDTGDGIMMGQAAGCNLKMMPFFWGEQCFHNLTDEEYADGVHVSSIGTYLYQGQPSSIFVNRKGRRFVDEATDYDSLAFGFQGQATTGDLEFTNVPAYYICDQSVRDTLGDAFFGVAPDAEMPFWAAQADTLEELAEKMGIDPDGLVATVQKWNEDVSAGVDTEFHRGESEFETYNMFKQGDAPAFAPIEQPPFYSAKIIPSLLGTKGGIEVDEVGHALHVTGVVIPRLYACGNSTGYGAPGKYYTGAGSTIGSGMLVAYLAAKDAATLGDWE